VLTFSQFGTIERLLENAMKLKGDHNPELRLLGIVVNQFNSQAKLPRKLIKTLIAARFASVRKLYKCHGKSKRVSL